MASKTQLNPSAPSFFPTVHHPFRHFTLLHPSYFPIHQQNHHLPPPPPPQEIKYHQYHYQPSAPPTAVAPPQVRLASRPATIKKTLFRPIADGQRNNWVPRRRRNTGVYVRVDRGKKTAPEKVFSGDRTSKQQVGCKNYQLRNQHHHEILPLTHESTTVMIRNIPNRYTRALLVEFLDRHCRMENQRAKMENTSADVTSYDFVYLPIDFLHLKNAGYAFVNFTDAKAALRFSQAFEGKSWDLFGSPKKINITRAKFQGRQALVNHFRRKPVKCDSGEFMPACFDPPRDGSSRATKIRTIGMILGGVKPKCVLHWVRKEV